MDKLPLFQPLIWSVTQLTRYIRELFESDEYLQDIWVQGEISNLSRPASGHIYFTLKDNNSSVRCVIWRNTALRQNYIPRDGQAVEVHGGLSVYEVSGQYQMYIDVIRPVGQGILYQEFLKLKEKLEKEGLFDTARKKPIPRWPHCIGVVTSPTGAAVQDVIHTIRRRYPSVRIVLAPTQVQGDEAPEGIIVALNAVNRLVKPDVILLVRGGGSIEDLWAFNDERVARAIASSSTPVISGVGHETDFTIADFVSDLRAPTPTAAAEIATPNRMELLADLASLGDRQNRAISGLFSEYEWRLNRLQGRMILRSPLMRLRSDQQRLDDLEHRSRLAFINHLRHQSINLSGIEQRLSSLNPITVLGRGYAIISHLDGSLVKSVQQINLGERLNVQVSDGEFTVKVMPSE